MSSFRRKARGGAGGKISALPPHSPYIFPSMPSNQSPNLFQERPSLRQHAIIRSVCLHHDLPDRVPLSEKSPNTNLLECKGMPLPRRVPVKVPLSLDRDDPAKRHRAASQLSSIESSVSSPKVSRLDEFQVVGKVQVSPLKVSLLQLNSQKQIMEKDANFHITLSERSARAKLHFVPKRAFSTFQNLSSVQGNNMQNKFCQFSASSARKQILEDEDRVSQKACIEENADCHITSSKRSTTAKLHFVPKMSLSCNFPPVQGNSLQNKVCQFSTYKRIYEDEDRNSLSSASNSPYVRSSVECTAEKEVLDSTYTWKVKHHISPSFYSSQQERKASFQRNLCSLFDRNDSVVASGSTQSSLKRTSYGVVQTPADELHSCKPKYTSQKNLSVVFNSEKNLRTGNPGNREDECCVLNSSKNKSDGSSCVGNGVSAFSSSPVSVLIPSNSNGFETPSSYSDDTVTGHEEKISCAKICYNVEGSADVKKQNLLVPEDSNAFVTDFACQKTSRYIYDNCNILEEHNCNAHTIYTMEAISCHSKKTFSSSKDMLIDQKKKTDADISLQDRLFLLQEKVNNTIGRSKENKNFLDSNLRSHGVLLARINKKLNMIEDLMSGLTICK